MRPQSVAVWREMFLGHTLITALSRVPPVAEPFNFALPSIDEVSVRKDKIAPKRSSQLRLLALKRRKLLQRTAMVLALVLSAAILYKMHVLEEKIAQHIESGAHPR